MHTEQRDTYRTLEDRKSANFNASRCRIGRNQMLYNGNELWKRIQVQCRPQVRLSSLVNYRGSSLLGAIQQCADAVLRPHRIAWIDRRRSNTGRRRPCNVKPAHVHDREGSAKVQSDVDSSDRASSHLPACGGAMTSCSVKCLIMVSGRRNQRVRRGRA